MSWIRWFLFNWLAAIFAFLAGRKLELPKKPVETQDDKTRIMDLLVREDLSEEEEAELASLSSKFDEVLVIEAETETEREGEKMEQVSLQAIYDQEPGVEAIKLTVKSAFDTAVCMAKENQVMKYFSQEFQKIEDKGDKVEYIFMSPREFSVLRTFSKSKPIDFNVVKKLLEAGIHAFLWTATIYVKDEFEGVAFVSTSDKESDPEYYASLTEPKR